MNFLSEQLQCKVRNEDEWMWDFICAEWNNNETCFRDEHNTIHLTSFVESFHVDEEKNCLLFEVHHAQYDNKCKYFVVFKKFRLDIEVIFNFVY